MWTKRFGVWCRSREHGVARAIEIPEEAWQQARREGREVFEINPPKKPDLHMVQPEKNEEVVQTV